MIPLRVLGGVLDIALRSGGAFAIVYGTVVIAGGAERWSAPQFRTALMVPGAPESWGIVLVTFGTVSLIATFVGRAATAGIGSATIGFWWTLLASAFLVEARSSVVTSWTAVVSGYAFAALYYSVAFLALIFRTWSQQQSEE